MTYLQGCMESMPGPEKWGWFSWVTVFFTWSDEISWDRYYYNVSPPPTPLPLCSSCASISGHHYPDLPTISLKFPLFIYLVSLLYGEGLPVLIITKYPHSWGLKYVVSQRSQIPKYSISYNRAVHSPVHFRKWKFHGKKMMAAAKWEHFYYLIIPVVGYVKIVWAHAQDIAVCLFAVCLRGAYLRWIVVFNSHFVIIWRTWAWNGEIRFWSVIRADCTRK